MKQLELDVGAPDLRNAYHLARISLAAYSDDPAGDHPTLARSFESVVTFQRGRVSGVAVGDGEHVVLTFRGRDEAAQWAESLAYGQRPWVVGRAHSGFMELLESVWPDVLAALFDLDAQERTLWLAGHSMGGALAVLAGQRLAAEHFDTHCVMTFGAPMVLDTRAADSYNARLCRFANNEDPVPGLRWPTLFDTYAHAGEEFFLLPSGDVGASRHSTELARKIDRAMHIGEGIFPSGPLHDHGMERYVEKLERHA